MGMQTTGQALVRLLETYGVDTVFGIPGVHTLELYRELPESSIRHVLTRHEQGAGFMADGYSRVSGKPGVCFVISGPGLTNIASAIGQAYSDSIPMLIISSVNETYTLGKGWGRLHETQNQRAISAPLTAFSATAYCSNDVPDLIAKAFTVFDSQRPRPVHIEIPLDILAAPIEFDWTKIRRLCADKPSASMEQIEKAAALLSSSTNPMIIAGGGAINAAQSIQTLAEKTTATVFTTVAAKGLLPPQHSLHGGSTLCLPPVWDFIKQADVILAIGTELADTDFWKDQLDIDGQIIRVDIDPQKMNDLYPATLAIVADAAETATQIANSIDTQGNKNNQQPLQQLKSTIENLHAPLQKTHQQILQIIQNQLPEKGFIATDMTQIAYTGNYAFNSKHTRSWLHPTGYGTLGYGLPAGIGAKIAAPNRPGLVLTGDGGILYTLQELATAVEEVNSPLVVMLWNNDALGQIRDDMISLDIKPVGVKPKNPNYIKIAEGFGAQTAQPHSLREFETALKQAFSHQGVSFIELHERYAFD